MGKCPVWLIYFKIDPLFAADADRLVGALVKLASEDLRFGYSKDPESGDLIAKVVDETHLDLLLDILACTHKVEVNVGAAQVAYRETIARSTEVDYTHKKQMGGTGQFARVKLRLEPNEPDAGNEFATEIVGGVVPKEYFPSVEKGVESVWDSGVIGFPMVDIKVTLFDGAYHEVDSSAIVFEIAARSAMRHGVDNAGVKLLEPIMDVEVVTPSDFVSSVIGDIKNRRGEVLSKEIRGNAGVIRAYVPLARLLGYRSGLSSITNGIGRYVMRLSHFAELPSWDGPDDFQPASGMRA